MQEIQLNVHKPVRQIVTLTPSPISQESFSRDPEESNLTSEYLRVLVRRRHLVAAMAVCGALLGFALTVSKQPMYKAHTSLDVQGVNGNFMNMQSLDPRAMPGEQTAESFLQTQVKLIESDSMMNRAVNRMSAASAMPPMAEDDMLSRLRQKLGLGKPEVQSMDVLLRQTAKSVKVKPIGLTRLVDISCESPSRTLAADFCNTLASEFISNDLEVRTDTAEKTGAYLATQLQDVKANLETKEQLLQSYAQQTTLLSTGDKEGVAQEKLHQLQTELSHAQADRIAKESQYELITATGASALPAVLDSGPLREYQTKLADLRQQYADLSASFTGDYPKVQRVEAQIKEMEATIARERQNVASRVKNDYEAAKQRETLLSAAYAAQAQTVTSLAPKETQFNMLQHEVESDRHLYESLLERVKEAGFISAMRTSPVRVVDRASEPKAPVSPQPVVAVALGLFGGCFGGILLAFFKDRTTRLVQMPGEAPFELHVRELGVIPKANIERLPKVAVQDLSASQVSKGLQLLSAPFQPPAGLELVTWSNKGSLMAESYRGVMSSLLFASNTPGDKLKLVVTSPSVGEGKTTLLSNLGIALAQTKRSVVLVDGDLRRPRLHKIFHVDNSVGLGDVLAGTVDAATCPLDKLVRATTVTGLYVIPAGTPVDDAASALFSPYLAVLMARLESEFSALLIDSPPMLHLTDARVLARYASGVVLVVRAGATTMDSAANARQIFEADGTPLVGTVLNDFDPAHEMNRGYYKSYHQYQQQRSA